MLGNVANLRLRDYKDGAGDYPPFLLPGSVGVGLALVRQPRMLANHADLRMEGSFVGLVQDSTRWSIV
jgi:hypothetical protein